MGVPSTCCFAVFRFSVLRPGLCCKGSTGQNPLLFSTQAAATWSQVEDL